VARAEGLVPSTDSAVGFQWRHEPVSPPAVGESILYVIKYGFLSAGSATLEVTSTVTVSGRTAYHVLSEARTNAAMDAFFKVRDKNESWVDAQSLCSLRFRQDLREGKTTRRVETVFDQPEQRFLHRKWKNGKESSRDGSAPPFVQDVLSALTYIRTRPLEVGGEVAVDANSGGVTWPLVVRVRRRESIRVPAGRFQCLRLEPVLAGEGIFQAKGRREVWVTEDIPHVPVLLRSKVKVGSFDAEMKDYRPGVPLPPSGTGPVLAASPR
jgi:hypothetical protein